MYSGYTHTANDIISNKQTAKPFFQPKLTINQPGDMYEREADAVAEKVLNAANDKSLQQTFFKPSVNTVQRKCAHCEDEEKIQRKEISCRQAHRFTEALRHINNL